MNQAAPESAIPLCVDLDGTLVKTDILIESALSYCKVHPLALLTLPLWLAGGRANLKRKLGSAVKLDCTTLPYNREVVDFLRSEQASGRELYLVTASDQRVAEEIAAHLNLFNGVIGSDGETNLKGATKADALAKRFGAFDYIGDHRADLAVWERAENSLAVGRDAGLIKKLSARGPIAKIFAHRCNHPKDILRAMRVHQWVKNLLLFVPLAMAHHALEIGFLLPTILAFFAFSFAASSVYLLNDLMDLSADRQHPTKRARPFASGSVTPQVGVATALILLGMSAAIGLSLPVGFQLLLLLYLVLTTAYSLRLKELALLDIMVLAALYSLRVLAGGYAAAIPVSEWLIAFSMFLFLSLACVKRFSELYTIRERGGGTAHGRGYTSDDLELIAQLGTASGYISVLVLALYINSTAVVKLYGSPGVLWLICPVLLFWISRTWLLAHRGEIHEDPILFALRDRVSYVAGAISLLILILSI